MSESSRMPAHAREVSAPRPRQPAPVAVPQNERDAPANCHATISDIAPLVGGTPLIQIHYRLDGHYRRLFAKYEQENMTGSVKDRMATYILNTAYQAKTLKRGDIIVEASSGNTGISFAAIGRALGHAVRIYMPNWMSQERVQLIRSLGAEIIPVSRDQGGFTGSIELCEAFAREHPNVFLPRQFDNPANIDAHYASTGPEIEAQLSALGVEADSFVAGVGTGGTVMGVGRFLRRHGRTIRLYPVEPANSPTLRTGCRVGQHRIQGISDEFVPSIIELDETDDIVDVWDGDAILMSQRLARELGLSVGISSGANFLGAALVAEMLGADATVVTILPDSNKKYLSTDLQRSEPVQSGYVSPRIELDGFRATRHNQ